MQNLTRQDELPFDLAHFQVEELEERLENKWQGKCKEMVEYHNDCTMVKKEELVDC
jgi:hypothetical protein